MDEPKTCERCGDDLRETLHSGGVKFDHFACGTIVYESGEGLEGLQCVRRQRDWSVAEVARLRAEGLKALCATADIGELAMNLTVEVDELRHLVVSLRSLGPVIQALAESGEMDPVTRQLLVAAGEVLIGPKVGDDATGAEHSGGAVSPAAPGPGPV